MEYLLEWMGKLGALSPVEVAMEAEEDEFDGMEDEEGEERREAMEQANWANEEDLEHGRSANIGQVYQVAHYVMGEEEGGSMQTDVEVWRKGVKLGSLKTILEVVPEAEVSIIGLDHLEALGVAREEVRGCLDMVRDELVVGQVELEVERVEREVESVEVEVERVGGSRLRVR